MSSSTASGQTWFRVVQLTLLSAVLLLASEARTQEPVKPGAERLQGLWNDLASDNESTASRALLLLTSSPKETIDLLRQHLRPVKVDPAQVARLVADLDNAKFPMREAAMKELEYLGKFGKPLLEKHLIDSTSPEVKRRLEELLARIPTDPSEIGPVKPAPPVQPMRGSGISVTTIGGQTKITIDGQTIDLSRINTPPVTVVLRPNLPWLRANRSVALLEHLGTPEARQLLQSIAEGERAAPPTVAAREALQRLGK